MGSATDVTAAWNRRASIEQPTSEAMAWKYRALAGSGEWRVTLNEAWARSVNGDNDVVPLYTVPPLLPPAKEDILQAMVDHDQALGLYEDVVTTDAQKLAILHEGLHELGWCAEFGALAKKVLFGNGVPSQNAGRELSANSEKTVNNQGEQPGANSAPVDERASEVVAWLLLDQGCRAPDDCEDFERVVLASEITAEELTRFKKDGRATALSISVLQQPQPSIIREALDIALDLANEAVADVHEKYKGHRLERHAAVDREVATVKAAIATLQQPGQADKVQEGWKWVPMEPTEAMIHAGEDVAIPRFFGQVYRAMLAAAPSPQDKP